jgi:iron complex outermembrane receptor protein
VIPRKLPGSSVALAVVLVRTLSAQAPTATPQGPDPPLPTIRETVVVTGGASPVTFETLGRTVRVLTREELARLPARDVADALRLVSSVSVRSRGAWGVQTDFAIRGATFGQTLVLVDGIRLNDAQTGHHNGDIPVPLEEIERVEVLLGPGSALFGADAFGGTINIITRRGVGTMQAQVRAGSFGSAVASASGGFERGATRQSVAVAFDRSDGFMPARDHRILTLRSQTTIGETTALAVAFTDKDFGANGFYGPSPSYEWTSQTLVSAEHRFLDGARLDLSGRAFYRTHGDRFLWDVRRPGQFENRHRTHAQGAALTARVMASPTSRVTGGLEQGIDWLRSSNLGDHDMWRAAGFVELQQQAGSRVTVSPAVRADYYSEFGTAWNPAVALSAWAHERVRVRGSIARAFRVPTFTERYYRDPAHQATADLDPERAWSYELGTDWLGGAHWVASGAVFHRDERDVIDWVRATPAERWRTTNIHAIRTRGVEAGVRTVARGAALSFDYTRLDSDIDRQALLSKYATEYARHAATASASGALPLGLEAGGRLEARWPAGRAAYTLVDARVTRRVGPVALVVEGTNLLDAEYQEVAGVVMPGRALLAGLAWPARPAP